MSVLLTILKILGILLLGILGLIICILLLVLMVPIRYRAQGSMQDSQKPELLAAVTWLYPILSIKAGYTNELDFSIKLLGITIYPKKKNDSDKSDSEELTPKYATEKNTENQEEQKEEQKTSDTKEHKKENIKEENIKEEKKINDETGKTEASETKPATGFIEKMQSIMAKADFYMEILTAEDTNSFAGKVFQTLLKILKSISPKNIKANVRVGFDDPAATGNVLAIHGMLYPWIGENVKIDADFDRKVLEGEFFLKGHIRSVSLLYHILRIVVDRRFYRLLKQLKKGGKTDDRK